MLRFTLMLRLVLLIPAIGAGLGALLMFWLGVGKVLTAARDLTVGGDATAVIGMIMTATDAFLFGVVLIIFAYAMTFGFVFELSAEQRQMLPSWMRVEGVSELKHTLVGVILVYLVVDFATDWAQAEMHPPWEALLMPLSILLIAGAFRLLKTGHVIANTHS
jgi:uncharacterized membrane protein YqhA